MIPRVEFLETEFCRWGVRDKDGPRTACASLVATAVAQALLRRQQQQQQQRSREVVAALKVELKGFSGRQEDWEDWRIEHLAKAEALGFAEELTTHEGRDIMVGAEGFDASGIDPVRLRQARQA